MCLPVQVFKETLSLPGHVHKTNPLCSSESRTALVDVQCGRMSLA